MRKVELLAPAGSMEALIAAVQNGCDAVYLGGTMFGARAFAANFDEDGMIQAIRYAHGYGVKVYVTMNTLLYETEMEAAIRYAQFLYEHGADALIIQDLGLFDVVHQCLPDMELHASTQMHLHNEAGIKLMHEAGMKRIVLPRETTIDEIRELAKLNVDLEVFVQGAMCVSYSGQCLMSAKKLGRSGNRGECAQMCRMKYRLIRLEQQGHCDIHQPGEYLLSPKDLNTLAHVPELIGAGIASFKIEGRMKSSEYVAVMVSLYRQAIDAYEQKQSFDLATAQLEMRKIFNRGFSAGYLFTSDKRDLMNPQRPNHMGIPIGKVLRRQGKRVTIALHERLHQFDGIRFLCAGKDIGCMVQRLYVDGLLVNEANAGTLAQIELNDPIPKGSVVLKTNDYVQHERLRNNSALRKVAIRMAFVMRKGNAATLTLSDDVGNSCTITAKSLPLIAQTPSRKERIQEQLLKCGGTIFTVHSITCDVDKDLMMPIKELNALRRDGLTQLYEQRVACVPRRIASYERHLSLSPLQGLYVSLRTQAQYDVAKQMGVQHIFVHSPLFHRVKSQAAIGYSAKRIMKESYPNAPILFCENSGMIEPDAIAEHYVNITNSYAAAFLFAHGVKGIICSSECSSEQRHQLMHAFAQRYGTKGSFLHYAYGREELMVMEYCPIHTCISTQGKQNCRLCKSARYALKDLKQHCYPLYGDEDCRMHIMDDHVYEEWEQACALYVSFFDEDEEACKHVLATAMQYVTLNEHESKV